MVYLKHHERLFDMVVPPVQELQSLEPRDYEIRIIVAGSRGYNDRQEFHDVLCAYIERFEGKPILFISGAARTGADNLIILWCKKFGYPCKEMPADWDNPELGKRAGYVRNSAMASVGTHLLEFYDGQSRGSAHMIDEAINKGIMVKIVRIEVPDPRAAKEPQVTVIYE